MNRYVALLLLCVGALFVGCIQHPEVRMPLSQRAKSQTVAIVETLQGDTRIVCSGVWINDDTFLTARHCVEAAAQMQFLAKIKDPIELLVTMMTRNIPKFEDDKLYGVMIHYTVEDEMVGLNKNPRTTHPALAIGVSKDRDIAVVRVEKDRPDHVSAPILASALDTGMDVEIVGHPKGLYWTYMKGNVSGVRDAISPNSNSDEDESSAKTYPYVQIVAPVWFGNSGGGAFDSHGCLVGIASFIVGVPNEAFFVHPRTIRDFLDENQIKYKLAM